MKTAGGGIDGNYFHNKSPVIPVRELLLLEKTQSVFLRLSAQWSN